MRPTRTRPTREETADRLLDGALAAFAERGFHGARIDDICARAGLTRGAFYSGFASKDDLFLALYDRLIGQVALILDRALAVSAATDGAGSVTAFFEAAARDSPIGREWYLLNAEFTLYAIRQPSAAPALAARRGELRSLLVDRLCQLLAQQDRVLLEDPDMLARALIAISDGGLAQHLVEPDVIEPTMLIRIMLPAIIATNSRPAVE